MVISKITPPTGTGSHTQQFAAHDRPAAEPVESRAVVPLERAVQTPVLRSARPDASFVAHLIAMAEQAPQTRPLRRATPADAQAMYDRARVQTANDSGRVLSQTA